MSSKEWAGIRAEKISYIMQGDSLLPNFTVLENICLLYKLVDGKKALEEKALVLLEEFGLEKKLGKGIIKRNESNGFRET